MTSTQVQRTLVKSAPEIWAELSDPAALARHLDPVGEIRITRAEPEQKVEWEGESACGTVLIKPSGWGTRVTLTLSREEGEPESGAVLETAAPPSPDTLSEATASAEPEREREPDAAGPTERLEPEPAAVSDAPDEAIGQDSPAAPDHAAPDQEPDPDPEPEPAGAPADRLEPEPEPAGAAPAERLELPPRRGFLARLLGRRQRTARPASSGAADSFHGLAVRSPGVGPWPTASAEWVQQFPRREPDSEIAPTEPEPELSREDMPGEQEVPAEAHPPSADDPPLGSGEPPGGAGADGHPENVAPGTVEPQADGHPENVAPGTVEPQADAPGEQCTASGELDAGAPRRAGSAEQEAGATERDVAVLTAVLDSLGTAHHRPFSRA